MPRDLRPLLALVLLSWAVVALVIWLVMKGI